MLHSRYSSNPVVLISVCVIASRNRNKSVLLKIVRMSSFIEINTSIFEVFAGLTRFLQVA